MEKYVKNLKKKIGKIFIVKEVGMLCIYFMNFKFMLDSHYKCTESGKYALYKILMTALNSV